MARSTVISIGAKVRIRYLSSEFDAVVCDVVSGGVVAADSSGAQRWHSIHNVIGPATGKPMVTIFRLTTIMEDTK